MSESVLGRLVRPAILLVAGMLLGQGALAIAAPSAPRATTQTRTASCAGFNFHPLDSATTYDFRDGRMYRSSNQGEGWFMCSMDLPTRAVVSKVRFTILDGHEDISFEYCGLVRTSLAPSAGFQVVGMAVTSTGLTNEPGAKRYSTTAIQNATVDNGAFAYMFQCHIVFGAGLQGTSGGSSGIIGADVTYRISSVNG